MEYLLLLFLKCYFWTFTILGGCNILSSIIKNAKVEFTIGHKDMFFYALYIMSIVTTVF